MRSWLSTAWKENKSLLVFIALMFVFRSALADWNTVPSGSMKPTILEGDRIFVNKMAYDVRIPFTRVSLLKRADPIRGDIVVFESAAANKRLVKRIVAVPGDVVAMKSNVLHINGKALSYRDIRANAASIDQTENLLGVRHRVRVAPGGSRLSSFQTLRVPANYYLALGDNRDASADSRVIGLVPRNEIVGRTRSVVLSFNYENFYIPRADRFFHRL